MSKIKNFTKETSSSSKTVTDADSNCSNNETSHSKEHLRELVRKQSVKDKIKAYQQQKIAIKAALCNIDQKANNKIVFEEECESNEKSKNDVPNGKTVLFESDGEEDGDDFNFGLKKQFEGGEGQKLFALQSKFKGDERFAIDERFKDNVHEPENDLPTEFSLEEEKKNEIDILGQVLGIRIKSSQINVKSKLLPGKKMLRFDPSQSESAQYEIPSFDKAEKKSKKRKIQDVEENEQDLEEEKVVVSKEVFYKVDDDLKDAFQSQREFSLLNTFNRDVEETEQEKDQSLPMEINSKNKFDSNPFRYDSSSDEGENLMEDENTKEQNSDHKVNTARLSCEPLFFRENDYRFDEGADFVKRIASERNGTFEEQRKNLKHVVRTKIRNNARKKDPFRKKLGGKKGKKFLKIKKAMH